jgi:hypothetical protein
MLLVYQPTFRSTALYTIHDAIASFEGRDSVMRAAGKYKTLFPLYRYYLTSRMPSMSCETPNTATTKLKLTNKAAISHDTFLAQKDQANAARIPKMTLKARAKNTNKNYILKQKEFIAWALKSEYFDRDIVTEAKLMSFLKEEVIH